jgi:hypothetical protein
MGLFGWSLPPGCGNLPGEELEPPCAVCGGLPDSDECICPECPECGEVGNPECYKPKSEGGHGMVRTQEQIDQLAEFEQYWEESNARE